MQGLTCKDQSEALGLKGNPHLTAIKENKGLSPTISKELNAANNLNEPEVSSFQSLPIRAPLLTL